jgi:hypothetical protein
MFVNDSLSNIVAVVASIRRPFTLPPIGVGNNLHSPVQSPSLLPRDYIHSPRCSRIRRRPIVHVSVSIAVVIIAPGIPT